MSFLTTSTCVRGLMIALAAAGAIAVSGAGLPAHAGESPSFTADDIDEAAKVLAKLDDEWSKAAATKDAERVASFYAEDAVAYPPNEPMATGRAAAKKVWAAYFTDASFTISWKTLHAEVSKSGELGFTSGPYQASYKGPDGAMVTEKGKYLCTWKKQKDGTWKATHDMWNTDAK
jgi:ketosteroid isomerase-like protein